MSEISKLTRKQKIRRIGVSFLCFFALAAIIGAIIGIVFGLKCLANAMGMSLIDLIGTIISYIVFAAVIIGTLFAVGLMCYTIADVICQYYEEKKQEQESTAS